MLPILPGQTEKNGGDLLAVKIKISYEHPEELQRILKQLQPDVKHWKVSRNREGRFRKAYIFIK